MYYHPDFNGSLSIKSVLPARFPDDAALDNKGLDIQALLNARGSEGNTV